MDIFHTDEKVGGKLPSIQKLKNFNDCISYCSLSDIRSTRRKWAWHNKVTGQKRIIGRLDRVLCNNHWIDTLPESCYVYLNHVPVIILLYF